MNQQILILVLIAVILFILYNFINVFSATVSGSQPEGTENLIPKMIPAL